MIAVVIPIFNEEDTIKYLITEVSNHCDFVVAVNDASTDKSGEILNNIKSNKLIIFENKKNLGIGGATKKGIKIAIENKADIIVKFDADGQHLADDIPKFIEQIINNDFDFVKGNRFKLSISQMPLVKLFGNLITTNLQKIVTGNFKISDPNNGFIAFKSEIFNFININNLRDDYFFENSFLMYLKIFKFKIAEIPIKTIYGKEVSSIPIILGSLKLVPIFVLLLYKKNYENMKQNLSLGSIAFYLLNLLILLKLINSTLISTNILLLFTLLYIVIEVINFLNDYQ